MSFIIEFIHKDWLRISLSGLFGFVGLIAVLLVFSAETGQWFLATFLGKLLVFLVVSIVVYMFLSVLGFPKHK